MKQFIKYIQTKSKGVRKQNTCLYNSVHWQMFFRFPILGLYPRRIEKVLVTALNLKFEYIYIWQRTYLLLARITWKPRHQFFWRKKYNTYWRTIIDESKLKGRICVLNPVEPYSEGKNYELHSLSKISSFILRQKARSGNFFPEKAE